MKDTKNRSTQISFFFSLYFILFCHQPFFRKIINTSLECCIDQNKSWNKWEKLLEILFTNNKVPWKCAVDPLINYPWNALDFPHLICVGTLPTDTILSFCHKAGDIKHITSSLHMTYHWESNPQPMAHTEFDSLPLYHLHENVSCIREWAAKKSVRPSFFLPSQNISTPHPSCNCWQLPYHFIIVSIRWSVRPMSVYYYFSNHSNTKEQYPADVHHFHNSACMLG